MKKTIVIAMVIAVFAEMEYCAEEKMKIAEKVKMETARMYNADAKTQGVVQKDFAKIRAAAEKALKWLEKQQMDNGSFSELPFPAVTALATMAFLKNGYREGNPVVDKAMKYIVSCVKPDGSIYEKALAGYNTAICLLPLRYAKNPKYSEIIENGRNYLIEIQMDEGEKIDRNHIYYGGIGYNNEGKPDLSNLSWALEALKETGENTMEQSAAFEKAIKFLTKCQNLKSHNDQTWASDDGGFIYRSDSESKAGEARSYGSMTYAGLKSFIYCSVDKSDPRVSAAFDWISKNFTVDLNPNMKYDGLYYYYITMAKALDVYKIDVLVDSNNKKRMWRKELVDKLISLQNENGYWVNDNSKRWLEDSKTLCTCYAVLALNWCYQTDGENIKVDVENPENEETGGKRGIQAQ
jgi:squalene-hopene/tetraprenyl-beta-curcumene cyclase